MRSIRHCWIPGALGLIVLFSGAARGEVKIGFINSDQVLEKFSGTRAAMDTFNKDVEGWGQDAATRKRELDQLSKDLAQQSPMLSDDKRREREQDYQRKLTEYDQFIQSIWGPNGLVVKRNEEILRPIITRIQTILAKIGAEQGYDLILDAANGNILYADTTLDLTQQVIEELNKQQP